MKQLVFLFVLMLSTLSAAETFDSLTLGTRQQETLWLRQKKIGTQEVSVIGYQSPQKRQLEKVMPRKDFMKTLQEFRAFEKQIKTKHAQNPNSFCKEGVSIAKDRTVQSLCMDTLESKDKQKFLSWFEKQSQLVIGL